MESGSWICTAKERDGVTPATKALTPEQQRIQELEAPVLAGPSRHEDLALLPAFRLA